MNRKHPGVPPSKRKNRPDDWRGRLRTTTQSLATEVRETIGYDDPETRRHLVASVRLALGEVAMDRLESGANSDDLDEAAVAVTARAYRLILDADGIDRDDPMIAESFMAVIERALDDMGLGWRSKIRRVTGLNVACTRQVCGLDGDEVRSKVLDDVRQSLGETASWEFVKALDTPDDRPEVERLVTTPPGTFRLILDAYDLDFRKPAVAEAVMAEVVAALDAELTGPR